MPRWQYITGLWLAAALIAAPASAQIVQSIHVSLGGFFPRGFDSRDPNDTIVADLGAAQPLDFTAGRCSASNGPCQMHKFRAADVNGEWSLQFGNHIEVSAGVGYYSRHVPSTYANLVNTDGSEIEQTLALRIIPVTGIVRFLPFGTPRTAQPYVGIGVSALHWRYSEAGSFVDPSDSSVFTDRFVATGTNTGPVALVGIRMPVGGDIYALTLEWRYQFGVGNTGGINNGFLGDKIDLGGGNLNIGFLVRF